METALAQQATAANHLRTVHVAGHELRIFLDTPSFVAAVLEDIKAAKQRVWVEMYIFVNDKIGAPVAEALKERARAGLDVRLLYDTIGSFTTPSWFFRDMEQAGVQVHAFHSFGEALRRFAIFRILNQRNHRKIVLIDDAIGYFGGMNLLDPTAATNPEAIEAHLRSTSWRDVQVRLAGPQQADLAESFERSWRRAMGEKIPRRPTSYRKAVLASQEESIQFFDTGPGRRNAPAARVFVQLFRRAHRSLLISMAYFLPLGQVLREIMRARKRGVFIRVIVPGLSDVPLVQRATRYLFANLLRRRIRLFERSDLMLHSKVMVIDDHWTVVGSCNLDPRSLWINLELLAVIHSGRLARTMKEIIKEDLDKSERVTLKECYQRSCWQRLLDRLAWTVRWWL